MRRQTIAKKEAITIAARAQFLADGFTQTNMNSIAINAKASKQTVYNYFPTKEALFVHVVEQILGEPWNKELLAGRIGELTEVYEFDALLHEIVQTLIKRMMSPEYIACMRIIFSSAQTQPELVDQYRKHVPEKALLAMTEFLIIAKRKRFITATPHFAARMLIGSLLTYALLQGVLANGSPRQPTKSELNGLTEEFIRYARRGTNE